MIDSGGLVIECWALIHTLLRYPPPSMIRVRIRVHGQPSNRSLWFRRDHHPPLFLLSVLITSYYDYGQVSLGSSSLSIAAVAGSSIGERSYAIAKEE